MQKFLLAVAVIWSLAGLVMGAAGKTLFAVLLFIAAVASLIALIGGTEGGLRLPLPRLRWRLSSRGAAPADPPEQQGQYGDDRGGGQDPSQPPQPRRPAPPLPGRYGQPGQPGQPGQRQAGPGPSGPAPGHPGHGSVTSVLDRPQSRDMLPEPPNFGVSAAGQAPWHLPGNAAPSGLAADAARLGDLEVRAASMVGAGHRCEEPAEPRQDAYALGRTQDGQYLIIAVADGVASSRHSDLGARVAVSACVRELGKMLDAGGIQAIDTRRVYQVVAGQMLGTGRDRKVADGDVCAILITAVVPAMPQANGTRPLWASWIGDVSLWIQRDGELHRCTGEDKSGLDRNKLNAVLPFNPDQFEQDTFALAPDDRVAIMTDGLSDAFSDVAGAVGFFARQWSGPPPHPAAFLHSLCYDAPGQGDDRTAVVVWTGMRPDRLSRQGR